MKQFDISKLDYFVISFFSHIYAHFQFEKARGNWWKDVYNYPEIGKEVMPFYMNKIKSSIEPERVLEFKVTDGWTPLCKFLNKEIPQESFPHLNDAEALVAWKNQRKKEAMAPIVRFFKQVTVIGIVLVTVGVLYWRWFRLDNVFDALSYGK